MHLFLAICRLFWTILPLPRDPAARDLRLMRRAGLVLDAYHNGTRPTQQGIRIAKRILRRHSMPAWAIRSMVRERDRDLIAQASRAADELTAEHAPETRKTGT
jgi:hypothetical protein